MSILLVAFLVRVPALDLVELRGDEVTYIKSGLLFLQLITQGKIFDPRWFFDVDVPPMGCYLIGLGLWLKGYRSLPSPFPPQLSKPNPYDPLHPFWNREVLTWPPEARDILLTARIVSVIFSSLTCVAFYYLGKSLKKEKIGFIAAMVWAFDPFSLLLARIAYLESIMNFFFTLSLITFLESIKKRRPSFILLSGILFGLASSSKMFGWLLILVLALWGFILITMKKFVDQSFVRKLSAKHMLMNLILCFFIGFTTFVVVWPFLYPDPFNRLAVSLGVTQELHGSRGAISVSFWLQQLVASKDIRSGTSSAVELVFFILGVLYFVWRPIKKQALSAMETLFLCWFLIPLLFLAFFIQTQYWTYTFILTPSMAFLSATGILSVLERISSKTLAQLFLGLILTLNAISVLLFYPTYRYNNLNEIIVGATSFNAGTVFLLITLVIIIAAAISGSIFRRFDVKTGYSRQSGKSPVHNHR